MARRSTEPVPPDEQNPARTTWRRLRALSRFSIQSKVMLMLLVASLASLGVIGTVEYVAARNALLPAASERMTQMRAAQKRAIETLFSDLSDSLVVYSHGTTALDAVREFTAGFDQLANAPVDPGQQRALVDFYTEKLIEPIERDTGKKLPLDAVLPSNNAQKYLQAHYTVAANRSSDKSAPRRLDAPARDPS